MSKKRFIAGAVCPKCHVADRVVLIMDDLERMECTACGYSEQRPSAADVARMQETVEPEGVTVVQFRSK